MPKKSDESRTFYMWLTLAISATAFIGFSFTYFTPMAAGAYPAVSPAIHVHGWSFFMWYLLLPLQAALMSTGYARAHIALGTASLILASVMTFTGFLVASVRIQDAVAAVNPGDLGAFWERFGLVVTSTLVVFVAFYVVAILSRRRPDVHKRFMIMASASALGAAVFRIIVAAGDFYWLATPGWVLPAAIFLPNAFIFVGMMYDFSRRRAIHPAYVTGLLVAVLIESVGFWFVDHSAGDAGRQLLVAFASAFGSLY